MIPMEDEFVLSMRERFKDYLNSEDEENIKDPTLVFICGSQQYEIEREAEEFLKKNPNPTPKELLQFFIDTAPEGLAPGDDGLDLLDDDDDE